MIGTVTAENLKEYQNLRVYDDEIPRATYGEINYMLFVHMTALFT